MADAANIILFALFIAALVIGGVAGTRICLRQYRLPDGRRYADLVAEHHAEQKRQAGLIAAWAEARERRIGRLERSDG